MLKLKPSTNSQYHQSIIINKKPKKRSTSTSGNKQNISITHNNSASMEHHFKKEKTHLHNLNANNANNASNINQKEKSKSHQTGQATKVKKVVKKALAISKHTQNDSLSKANVLKSSDRVNSSHYNERDAVQNSNYHHQHEPHRHHEPTKSQSNHNQLCYSQNHHGNYFPSNNSKFHSTQLNHHQDIRTPSLSSTSNAINFPHQLATISDSTSGNIQFSQRQQMSNDANDANDGSRQNQLINTINTISNKSRFNHENKCMNDYSNYNDSSNCNHLVNVANIDIESKNTKRNQPQSIPNLPSNSHKTVAQSTKNKRNKAAVLIQKTWRGFLTRKLLEQYIISFQPLYQQQLKQMKSNQQSRSSRRDCHITQLTNSKRFNSNRNQLSNSNRVWQMRNEQENINEQSHRTSKMNGLSNRTESNNRNGSSNRKGPSSMNGLSNRNGSNNGKDSNFKNVQSNMKTNCNQRYSSFFNQTNHEDQDVNNSSTITITTTNNNNDINNDINNNQKQYLDEYSEIQQANQANLNVLNDNVLNERRIAQFTVKNSCAEDDSRGRNGNSKIQTQYHSMISIKQQSLSIHSQAFSFILESKKLQSPKNDQIDCKGILNEQNSCRSFYQLLNKSTSSLSQLFISFNSYCLSELKCKIKSNQISLAQLMERKDMLIDIVKNGDQFVNNVKQQIHKAFNQMERVVKQGEDEEDEENQDEAETEENLNEKEITNKNLNNIEPQASTISNSEQSPSQQRDQSSKKYFSSNSNSSKKSPHHKHRRSQLSQLNRLNNVNRLNNASRSNQPNKSQASSSQYYVIDLPTEQYSIKGKSPIQQEYSYEEQQQMDCQYGKQLSNYDYNDNRHNLDEQKMNTIDFDQDNENQQFNNSKYNEQQEQYEEQQQTEEVQQTTKRFALHKQSYQILNQFLINLIEQYYQLNKQLQLRHQFQSSQYDQHEQIKEDQSNIYSPSGNNFNKNRLKISELQYLCQTLKKISQSHNNKTVIDRCLIQFIVEIMSQTYMLEQIYEQFKVMIEEKIQAEIYTNNNQNNQNNPNNQNNQNNQQLNQKQQSHKNNSNISSSNHHGRDQKLTRIIDRWLEQLQKWQMNIIQEVPSKMQSSSFINTINLSNLENLSLNNQ